MIITDTGAIRNGERVCGQIQIVTDSDNGKRVQLYTENGIFLCECLFEGDNDKGYEIGMGMYKGYVAGFQNCEFGLSRAINKALRQPNELNIE